MLLAPTPIEPHRAVRLATPDSLDALLASEEHRVPQVPRPPLALTWESKTPAPGAPHLPLLADVGLKVERTIVGERQAIEETYFLGLRMNRGVELGSIEREFGSAAVGDYRETIAELVSRGLLAFEDGWLRLTAQGRLLSNEVFAAFLRD